MKKPDFEWGPLARGVYAAMLWLTILLGLFTPTLLLYYVPLLLFAGFLLRPLLRESGIHGVVASLLEHREERRWRKVTEQRRRDVDRKQRDARYRGRRYPDPRLPKNW